MLHSPEAVQEGLWRAGVCVEPANGTVGAAGEEVPPCEGDSPGRGDGGGLEVSMRRVVRVRVGVGVGTSMTRSSSPVAVS